MSEASTADLRAKLDEPLHGYASRWPTEIHSLRAALRAVLDLCDQAESEYAAPISEGMTQGWWGALESMTAEVRTAIAASLGVQRATPPCGHVDCGESWCRDQLRATPAEPLTHNFVVSPYSTHGLCAVCGRYRYDHQQRGEGSS